jgi:hypothetical protein
MVWIGSKVKGRRGSMCALINASKSAQLKMMMIVMVILDVIDMKQNHSKGRMGDLYVCVDGCARGPPISCPR